MKNGESQHIIPHNKPTIEQDDKDSVAHVLMSDWIAQGGKLVEEFEESLSAFLDKEGKTLAVESGTAALHLALLSLNVKKGDEVILPTYVCTALLNAVNYIGAKPILADINSYDFNISFDSTRKKITPRTKALIIPHMYGIPADIDDFLNLNVPIIEDCAQSIGAKFKNKKVGTFGDVSIFSFYATKLLTTAKGGAIYSKNRELIEFLSDLVHFDCRPTYKIRYNYGLTDYQAALGLSQLNKLDTFIARRKEIAQDYTCAIGKKKDHLIVKIPEWKENICYRYILISNMDPSKVKEAFLTEGIRVINPLETWELLHNYLHLRKSDFPNSEKISRQTISIPIYPSLSDEEIYRIKNSIHKIYR